MNEGQIAELLVPFLRGAVLSDSQLRAFRAYLDLLVLWNSKVNLTAVRGPEEIVTRHFGESLFAAGILFPQSIAQSVVDIGSGAGFPGIPIKIWNQQADLTLVESNQKKAVFLREVARTLKIDKVSVEVDRAERLSASADLVTLRAVERFEQVLLATRRLLKPQGKLAMLIGSSRVQIAMSLLPELAWSDPKRTPQSENRVLLVGKAGP
jgi:16S rRNA (guanine527-N7)-methyltransferase